MSNAFSVNQLLNKVSISRALLYRLWAQKKGPRCIFIGRRRFVTEAALDEWLKNLEREAGK